MIRCRCSPIYSDSNRIITPSKVCKRGEVAVFPTTAQIAIRIAAVYASVMTDVFILLSCIPLYNGTINIFVVVASVIVIVQNLVVIITFRVPVTELFL
jgi:hypothetical protein